MGTIITASSRLFPQEPAGGCINSASGGTATSTHTTVAIPAIRSESRSGSQSSLMAVPFTCSALVAGAACAGRVKPRAASAACPLSLSW